MLKRIGIINNGEECVFLYAPIELENNSVFEFLYREEFGNKSITVRMPQYELSDLEINTQSKEDFIRERNLLLHTISSNASVQSVIQCTNGDIICINSFTNGTGYVQKVNPVTLEVTREYLDIKVIDTAQLDDDDEYAEYIQ